MTIRIRTGRIDRPRRIDPSDGDPVLAAYLVDIADSRPLTSGEEAALAIRIHRGDGEARNLLVEANLRFVVTVAKEYQSRGLSLAELISAGNLGLLAAAERFDETRGFKFISYAVWWVRQAILQALLEQSTVRLPVSRIDTCTRITRASEALQQAGEPATRQEIARFLGCTTERVEQALIDGQAVRSLDAPFEDGEGSCLLDNLWDPEQPSPEDDVLGRSLHEQVTEVLRVLATREAEIVRLYFGLGEEPPLTLDQIGIRLRLTRERVRQIKEVALAKMRHPRLGGRLRCHLER
jgi:RNA polymerase primary sigma factor